MIQIKREVRQAALASAAIGTPTLMQVVNLTALAVVREREVGTWEQS